MQLIVDLVDLAAEIGDYVGAGRHGERLSPEGR